MEISISPWRERFMTEPVRLLSDDNPALAAVFLDTFHADKARDRETADLMANAMVRIVRRAGLIDTLHNAEDFTKDPMLFWDLLDAVRAENPAEGDTLELQALARLYVRIANTLHFPAEYEADEKSPLSALIKGRAAAILGDHAMTRDTFFAVAFRHHPTVIAPLKMAYESGYLASRVVRTMKGYNLHPFLKSINDCKDFAEGFERWFDNSIEIRSYTDFTPTRMDAAIKKICATVADPIERQNTICFLFRVWRDLLFDFPDHNFFAGSPCYNSELVLNPSTPLQLAKGFRLVAISAEEKLMAMDKILFVINREFTRTANGRHYSSHIVDLSDIQDPVWKQALTNYAYKLAFRGDRYTIYHIKDVVADMVRQKEGDGHPYCILRRDARRIVSAILASDILERTMNSNISKIKRFLEWAVESEYITAEPGAIRCMKGPKTRYRAKPRPVQFEDFAKVSDTLTAMYTETGDSRYALARCLMHIQLLSEVRMGQLCALMVSRMTFNEDGSSISNQRAKNSGNELDDFYFSPEATAYIREAMDLSRPLRAACPVGTAKDNIFVYAGVDITRRYVKFSTMSMNKILRKACERAGVKAFYSGNIRDTMMTYAKKMALRLQLTDAEQQALTGHVNKTSTNFYYFIDLKDVLKAAKDIDLGGTKKC